MKDKIKQINIGQGLGDLQFGMSRAHVSKLLGDPTEIDNNPYNEADGDRTENWHYDHLKLSLSFQEPIEWELDTISVTDEFYQIRGKSLMGKSLQEVKSILEDMDITDLETENHSDDDLPDHKLLTSDSYLINFWFDKDKLVEIQWGPDDA